MHIPVICIARYVHVSIATYVVVFYLLCYIMFSRPNNNHSKDDEDSHYLVDKPAQACYWEFNDKYELQRNK